MTSTTVWIGVVLLLVFLALAYLSAWLHGLRLFLLTIGALAGSLGAFCIEMLRTETGASLWFGLSTLAWVFLFFLYLIGSKYLTRTKLLDLTYQSHPALLKYISEHRIVSPLASTLRVLGPTLLVAMLVLVALGFWAKSKGALV